MLEHLDEGHVVRQNDVLDARLLLQVFCNSVFERGAISTGETLCISLCICTLLVTSHHHHYRATTAIVNKHSSIATTTPAQDRHQLQQQQRQAMATTHLSIGCRTGWHSRAQSRSKARSTWERRVFVVEQIAEMACGQCGTKTEY